MIDFFKFRNKLILILYHILFFVLFIPIQSNSQSVSVGKGSYSTSLPSGEVGPQNFEGQNVSPKISSSFALPVQSNDFWSSLIYPYFKNPHSNILYAHPLNAKAVITGLEIGYTTDHIFVANDFLYPYAHQLTVGVSGLTSSKAETHHYGDWTVTALWKNGAKSMEATLGHGLPFVFFRISGGDAVITSEQSPNIWHNQDEVLGITIDGRHYGIFAPTGSTWSGTSTFQSSLNGKDYLSVALLPDSNPETIELFRKHAYAFVTNSVVDWDYNESISELISTYTYETVLMDSNESNIDETLTALYRHQWLNSSDPLTNYSYHSPRGEMKLYEGSSFSTQAKFSGVLPALPDRGDYNRTDLLNFVQSVATETLPVADTYWDGKAMARFTHLIHIADQLGATTERDHFLSQIKNRLEDWFTVGGEQEYSYIANWDVLTGYPSEFGADNQINDHHFHASYAIMSAATIAKYDSAWASQENWGGMVNLLIKDANNWDRSDTQFPFLRTYDAYAGHSWAAGHGDFAEGNNQESSSESMNFANASILWGEATGQDEIRDMGIFLHTTETFAVEQYWFDIDNVNFPEDYPHVAIGIVWGGKGVHSTWFGADPEFIHGINILPVTSGSLYLGRHPDYVIENYNEIVSERNSQPVEWKDILWEYLALSDPALALSYYYADQSYEPEAGESRAHTLHWLYNLKKMGHLDTTTFADIPTYSVFKNQAGDLTYVAYNAGSTERLVTFSDGFSMTVGPREMNSFSTSNENPDAPVVLLLADKTSGKMPLTINFEGNKSYDRNESPLTYHWDFGDGTTAHSADTTKIFTEVGTFKIVLTVTNEQSHSSKDSVTITVRGNGTPFSGSPPKVPAKIEAEDYDNGGEGIAYHDVDANNAGLAYRPDEGVDIIGVGGGYAVYWIVAGEWIEYTFEVEEAGNYDFVPYAATVPGFGNFTLFIDNVDVSGKIPVPHTGGFENWTPFATEDVHLETGVHIMRFEFDSDSDKTEWLFSLNYIEVSKSIVDGIEDQTDLPTDFKLMQNYPNPFNPNTIINYSVPKQGKVTIAVFNALGKQVATLVNEEKSAGNYKIDFNAENLSSGIYFYKMQANEFIQTKKMLLLK